ncbi:bifunctional aminoglycoside phosphotransferase/ATP-binding protein [Methylomonas albis]|uniref:bifunctional aminoglycoside phosphotransferase/ATP-binding protein n=1 Tax=Methylomonas albis TaxID=1854563 RepID=UPI001E2E0ADA|nr:bifunctional aminoglycoside phosphotransferase/ATP-binding protein [Methylomonas albis]
MDSLAETVAKFHTGLPPANPESDYGAPAAIDAPARQNFQQLLELLPPEDAALVNQLQDGCRQAFLAAETLFKQRQQAGFIRECHGDLHLGNIVLLRGRPVAFDGIEFSPALRWIDTISDAAFLIMDLVHRGRADLAYRFLNAYLQINGDFAGLGVLRFYLSYRAAVRAKIAGFRFAQTGAESARQECLSYLSLAGSSLRPRKPALILTHGLPGCGKSAVSQLLLEKHQLIRLRSDVERKRLFGLSAGQNSGSAIDSGLYDPQVSQKTYRHLLSKAQTLLEYGFALIIDASFLKHAQRSPFQLLAQNQGIPFVILSITATEAVLRQRILHRQAEGFDASEADLAVLDQAMTKVEALQAEELPYNLVLANDNDGLDKNDRQAAWRELARVLE